MPIVKDRGWTTQELATITSKGVVTCSEDILRWNVHNTMRISSSRPSLFRFNLSASYTSFGPWGWWGFVCGRNPRFWHANGVSNSKPILLADGAKAAWSCSTECQTLRHALRQNKREFDPVCSAACASGIGGCCEERFSEIVDFHWISGWWRESSRTKKGSKAMDARCSEEMSPFGQAVYRYYIIRWKWWNGFNIV